MARKRKQWWTRVAICVHPKHRTTYQSLGSWALAADQGQTSKELHIVYASPGTIIAYLRDGRFPDGAVLVKEMFQAAPAQMTTVTVSHAEAPDARGPRPQATERSRP
jgi:hypothetical protein